MRASSPVRKRITRADVAKFAGVSSAVVSYVVNDGPGVVAPATRQRVLSAIDTLGYQPDVYARALATGSSQLLALVVPDISNPLFGEFAVSVESAAAKRGYALLLASSENDAETERRHINNLVGRRVDGLLLSSVLPNPDTSAADNTKTRVVLLNAFKPRPGYVTVGTDAHQGAYTATEHLIDHGHRNIGLVIGRTNSSDLEAREAGWLQALTDHNLNPGSIVRDEFTREGGYNAARRLIQTLNRPTALFVSSDLQAIGVISALYELGLRVPEDVAIVSFDGTEETRFTIPPLTTVRQPIELMANHLVENVLDPASPHDSHAAFATELIVRKSCGAHPSHPAPRDGEAHADSEV